MFGGKCRWGASPAISTGCPRSRAGPGAGWGGPGGEGGGAELGPGA